MAGAADAGLPVPGDCLRVRGVGRGRAQQPLTGRTWLLAALPGVRLGMGLRLPPWLPRHLVTPPAALPSSQELVRGLARLGPHDAAAEQALVQALATGVAASPGGVQGQQDAE